MYAYCLNDPVDFVDPSGMATWWEKQGLTAANEIHNVVMDAYWKYYVTEGIYDVVWTNVYLTNVTKNGKQGKTGYADLVLEDIGGKKAICYEIKSVQTTTKEIAKGVKQLGEYLTGSWMGRAGYSFQRGATAPSMVIYYSNEKYNYTVYTYYAERGVIAYWYTKSKKVNTKGQDIVRGLADGVLWVGAAFTAYVLLQGTADPEQVTRAVEQIVGKAA